MRIRRETSRIRREHGFDENLVSLGSHRRVNDKRDDTSEDGKDAGDKEEVYGRDRFVVCRTVEFN